MHALDPATGGPLASFGPPGNPGIGPILGMAAVDYSTNPQRIYFATRRGTAPETLWCVELGPPGPLAFTLRWKVAVGDISGSVVLRNGRVYVGNDLGQVLSVRASDGGDVVSVTLGDGAVRGFVFPDRASQDVYVSTDNTVFRLTDNVTNWITKWSVAVNNPSAPLLWPGTTHVYVGGGDGRLHEIDTQTAAHKTLALDYDPPTFVVGAPSLDIGFGLVHVGSERGTFYAVRVPLP
jgi:outer membrane protein assembly factor BamB